MKKAHGMRFNRGARSRRFIETMVDLLSFTYKVNTTRGAFTAVAFLFPPREASKHLRLFVWALLYITARSHARNKTQNKNGPCHSTSLARPLALARWLAALGWPLSSLVENKSLEETRTSLNPACFSRK
jgi:hypothetical protein